MGILNVTPDSFYAESRVAGGQAPVHQAGKMLRDGARVLDLGAQSTRPGAQVVDAKEEWLRLEAPLRAIRKAHPEALLSIDTFYGEVAKRALDLGADIINDVTAGLNDPTIVDAVAQHSVPFIAMHNPAKVGEFHKGETADPVLKSVFSWLRQRIEILREKQVHDILIDPGFGFGKTLEQNWKLLEGLEMLSGLHAPILIGLSRKSMIFKPLNISPEDALAGTIAAHTLAVNKGANIVRVHDVKEAAEAIQIAELMHHG